VNCVCRKYREVCRGKDIQIFYIIGFHTTVLLPVEFGINTVYPAVVSSPYSLCSALSPVYFKKNKKEKKKCTITQ
jgi:hypothetical protein